MDLEITAEELKSQMENGTRFVIIDVREPWEFESGNIEKSFNVPVSHFTTPFEPNVPKDAEIITVCAHGHRSLFAAKALIARGPGNDMHEDDKRWATWCDAMAFFS